METSIADKIFSSIVEFAVKPCAIAGFFVLVAFLWTLLLQHAFAYPFLFLFFGAVMGSAWFGGTIAGMLAVIFSTLSIAYFFVPPLYSWSIDTTAKTYFIAFIVSAATVSWVSSAKKRGETAIREARDSLEERVQERTAELERSYADIKESERRLRLLTEAIPQQIWSAGPDGEVDYCNQHLLAYLGLSLEDAKGHGFLNVFHAEDAELFRQAWEGALEGGSRLEGEWRVRDAGGRYRWFLVRCTPQESADGGIVRWYATHIDIESLREAEQALLEAQADLARLSRTLSMGELAAGIMHEINQPLTAVVTHAYACREWLLSAPANLAKASQTADRIIQESTRACEVASRVRALFEKAPPAKERLDINQVIRNLIRLLRDEAIRREVHIHSELDKHLPHLEADRVQIEQVLLNLAINGMDAMAEIEGAKELRITSACEHSREVLVRVEDCGKGLDPSIAAKIFEPFFTTKSNGIGMGLAISRSIIEGHDGRLWASARPSGGTTFAFTLPAEI